MATGKKYYWIKLKNDFMTSDTVDFLMGQKNGAQYVVLYQMLCLMCINTNGELARQIGEVMIPFDVDKIHRDCKYFSRDTITIALGLFKKLGLIYEQESGSLIISDFENLIGSETDYARQKRIQRKGGQNQRYLEDNNVDNVSENVSDLSIQSKSIDKETRERDKSLEKDTEKDEEKEGAKAPKKKSAIYYPNDEKLNQAFIDFVDMRKKIKKPMTERAIDLAMNNLQKLSNGDNEIAIQILERSVMNSWLGLFPLSDSKSRNNTFDEWRDA